MYYIIYKKNNINDIAVTKTSSINDAFDLYFQLKSANNQVSVLTPENQLLIGEVI